VPAAAHRPSQGSEQGDRFRDLCDARVRDDSEAACHFGGAFGVHNSFSFYFPIKDPTHTPLGRVHTRRAALDGLERAVNSNVDPTMRASLTEAPRGANP